MGFYAGLNSFNAGELSPKMNGRSDVSQYSKGCRVLQNFLVTPYGSVERRPGTIYRGTAKGENVRLIRFVYSATVAYVCEFGEKYIRFYRNGERLTCEVETPYLASELRELQYVQSADVMTIVHGNHHVYELRRTTESEFELIEKTYEYPPVLDPNIDEEHTLTPSALEGEDITITATKDTFAVENIGGFYEITHTRKGNEINKDFEADGESESLEVYGYWTFTTHGTWSGTVKLQRSYDKGISWEDYRIYSSQKDSNVSASGEEESRNVLYRIVMTDYEMSDSGTLKLCRCSFTNPDFKVVGIVQITDVTDSLHAKGKVLQKLGDVTATMDWAEGAWSERRGYPRTIAFYEERMFFGGTKHKPQTVWASKTGDWDNYLLGDKADDGLEFTLASDTVNTICWLCQHQALIIGTMDSEWTLSASDSAQALTPTNFQVKRQSVFGSKGIAAQMVGETILFAQRGGRKVREFVFQWEKNGYTSPDMTILAEHVTKSGIVETALQQLPDSILWCVLGNGTLAALTYERDQEVIGWHRHVTAGEVISCCVIPAGNEDQIYLAVRRGNGLFIEEMGSRSSGIYTDSSVTVTGQGLVTVTGLDHLEGMDVQVLADGAMQSMKKVVGGSIELDIPADHAVVGLGYDSVLSPMSIEIEMQDGQSILRKKSIGELRIRFYGTVGGEVRCGSDSWQKVYSYDVQEDNLDTAIAARDSVVTFNVLSGNDYAPVIEIRQRDPLPMNVTNLVALYDIVER